MKMLCDLHTHSTTSDGQYTPLELVSLARQAPGLPLVAQLDRYLLKNQIQIMTLNGLIIRAAAVQ